jgi:two-component system sensor histidine kinase KdpD
VFVGVFSLVFGKWFPLVRGSAGPIYILIILLIAAGFGSQESLAASVVATIGWLYYFIPPRDSFKVTGFQDWLSLFTFVATALIASHLSERAKRRTTEAVARQQEMERLYALGRAILMTSPDRSFASQIAEQILRIYKLRAAAVFDRREKKVYAAGTFENPAVTLKLEEAASCPTMRQDWETGTTVCSITLGGEPIGGLALIGGTVSSEGLQALANLVAVGIARVRAEETASRAEAARESQEFKSTLIDALAHEFKTPLTSLKGAASAILSNGVSEPRHQKELLSVIDQDASRLNSLVNEALHIARVEAGNIVLRRKPCVVREMIEQVLAQMEIPLEGRSVDVSVCEDVPAIPVDDGLIQLALKQLIDNAIKYSPADTPLRIRATANGDAIFIRLSNEGNGIPEDERSKIFERFYRGQKSRNLVTGSGMGLAIAREIIRAHGGDLRLESHNGSGKQHGAEFVAVLSSQWNGKIQEEQA